jgi:hypothetical protein
MTWAAISFGRLRVRLGGDRHGHHLLLQTSRSASAAAPAWRQHALFLSATATSFGALGDFHRLL